MLDVYGSKHSLLPMICEVDAVGIGPGGTTAATRHGAKDQPRSIASTSFTRLGHGGVTSIDYSWGYPSFEEPELDAYYARRWEERVARHEAEGRPIGGLGPSTMFPAMSMHAGSFPRALIVAHPVSPTETEVWRWYLVDSDLPDSARDWMRRWFLRYSGPAGLVEQDDMENWDYATAASLGTIARRYPYNYQLGLGMTKATWMRDAVESSYFMTEENARNYYRRWAEFMSGAPWSKLMAGI